MSLKLLFGDTETTGFKENRLISLAIVYYENGKRKDSQYIICDPKAEIELGASKVNGFTQKDVEGKPTFDKIWPSVKKYFEESIWIFHNAKFDESVITNELKRYNIPVPDHTILCTCENARLLISKSEIQNYKLDTLCDYFNIHFENHHTASFDTMACMRIYNRLVRISGGNLDTKFIEGDY